MTNPEKMIPWGVIATIVSQSAGLLIWGVAINAKVDTNEKQITEINVDIEKIKNAMNQDLSQIKTDVTRIKTILEFADVDIEKKKLKTMLNLN